MSEFEPIPNDFEQERREGLVKLVAEHLDKEDAAFLEDMADEEEIIGYVYGRLLEECHDPDELLEEYGVTEGGSDEI